MAHFHKRQKRIILCRPKWKEVMSTLAGHRALDESELKIVQGKCIQNGVENLSTLSRQRQSLPFWRTVVVVFGWETHKTC